MTKKRALRHFDSLPQEAFLNLWRTYDRLREFEDQLFGEYDLTPQQYNTLRILRGEYPDALPTLAVAARLVTHAPDITRLVDKLESRGLIERERPVENRRVVLVRVTEAGLLLLDEIDEPLRDCHQRQLGHLSAAQLRQLIALLKEVRGPHEGEGSSWK